MLLKNSKKIRNAAEGISQAAGNKWCFQDRYHFQGLRRGLSGRDPPTNAGDTGDVGLIHGSGRSPGEGSDNPLQYACLENPMDRGAWWATVPGVTKSWTRLSMHACTHTHTHTHTHNHFEAKKKQGLKGDKD